MVISHQRGCITLPVNTMDHMRAVCWSPLLLAPPPPYQQVYEAENATVVNAGRFSSGSAFNGGHVDRIDGSQNAQRGSFVDFLVNVPTAGNDSMALRHANGTGATSTQGLAYNGGAWQTVFYPPAAGMRLAAP